MVCIDRFNTIANIDQKTKRKVHSDGTYGKEGYKCQGEVKLFGKKDELFLLFEVVLDGLPVVVDVPHEKNKKEEPQDNMQIVPLLFIKPQERPTTPVCDASVRNKIEHPA